MIRVCYKTRRGAHLMAQMPGQDAANLLVKLAKRRIGAIASSPDGGWFGEVAKIDGRWAFSHVTPQVAA